MKGEDPDAPLLAEVAEGRPAAIQTLVARKLPGISALAFRLLRDGGEAEDVAQEALLRAWRHAPRWRAGGAARFDTWLHTVVLNLCRDRLRRRRERPVATLPDRADNAPNPGEAVEAQETAQRVHAALGQLPQRQREAIVMRHYQELSHVEAAKALGVSVEALESLLSRGRRQLRVLLKEDET